MTHEPGLTKSQAEARKPMETSQWPSPPKFEDKYEEREYLKGRLALAFRIFAKRGYDEGVAGHITLRVSSLLFLYQGEKGNGENEDEDETSGKSMWSGEKRV
jgi:hypothetical protein